MDFSKPQNLNEEHKLSEDTIQRIRDNEHFKQFQKELRKIVEEKVKEKAKEKKVERLNRVKPEDDCEGHKSK